MKQFIVAATILLLYCIGETAASDVVDGTSTARKLLQRSNNKCQTRCNSNADCDRNSNCRACREVKGQGSFCLSTNFNGPTRLPQQYPVQFPAARGDVRSRNVIKVVKGTVFDCGMRRYQRNFKCEGQAEGGRDKAMFWLEEGATLQNCIIGPDQSQGVYCDGGCTINNVWWEDVCEDALTFGNANGDKRKGFVNGGGARYADDKVIQQNGGGEITITNFYIQDFGKVYRSCGNCPQQFTRFVNLVNVTAVNGYMLAGINPNYGDKATFRNIKTDKVQVTCGKYRGVDVGRQKNDSPKLLSTGYDSNVCRLQS